MHRFRSIIMFAEKVLFKFYQDFLSTTTVAISRGHLEKNNGQILSAANRSFSIAFRIYLFVFEQISIAKHIMFLILIHIS